MYRDVAEFLKLCDARKICKQFNIQLFGNKVRCPFHDEIDPSCNIYGMDNSNVETNFHCFGCKATGNFIDLFCKVTGTDKSNILQLFDIVSWGKTSEIKEIPTVFQDICNIDDSNCDPTVKNYLYSRGLSDKDIATHDIKCFDDIILGDLVQIDGYDDVFPIRFKYAVFLPCKDFYGRIIYGQMRFLDHEKNIKYVFPKTTKDIIKVPFFIPGNKGIVLCESAFDSISLERWYPDYEIHAIGGSSIKKAIKILDIFFSYRVENIDKIFSKVILAFDNDDVGKRITMEICLAIFSIKFYELQPVSILDFKNHKDANECLVAGVTPSETTLINYVVKEKNISTKEEFLGFKAHIKEIYFSKNLFASMEYHKIFLKDLFETIFDVTTVCFAEKIIDPSIKRELDLRKWDCIKIHEEHFTQKDFGHKFLTENVKYPIGKGVLGLISGVSGIGKTSLCNYIIANIIKDQNKKILIYSMDMSTEMHMLKLKDQIIDNGIEFTDNIKSRIIFGDENKIKLNDILFDIEETIGVYGEELDAIFIDYLNLIEPDTPFSTTTQFEDKVISSLHSIVRKHNVSVYLIVQTGKNGEIRGSAVIKASADFVIELKRESKLPNYVILCLEKNRYGRRIVGDLTDWISGKNEYQVQFFKDNLTSEFISKTNDCDDDVPSVITNLTFKNEE